MDENSFIAVQLRQWALERILFEPFDICLRSGALLSVVNPTLITFLSGGVILIDEEGVEWVFGYESIVCLKTLFEKL